MKSQLTPVRIETAQGTFTAFFSDKGLAQLDFPAQKTESCHRSTLAPSSPPPAKIRLWTRQTRAALDAIFAGQKCSERPPLDWSAGTPFQKRVWSILTSIPAGRTLSYGEIAEKLKSPAAARAVGGACGANPIPVIVPCHRVLAANRKLGGFSGGLDWKRKLLAAENVVDLSS